MDKQEDLREEARRSKPALSSIIPLLAITILATCLLSFLFFYIENNVDNLVYGPDSLLPIAFLVALFIGSFLAAVIRLGRRHPRHPWLTVILLSLFSMLMFLVLVFLPRFFFMQ